jgi:AraC family transcriptional regulator
MTAAAENNFHGSTLVSREVDGFIFREIFHSAGVSVPKHTHENAHVGVILRGGFEERCEGRVLDCRPMSVSYLGPGMSHSDEFRHDVHCFVFEISCERLARLSETLRLDRPVMQNRGPLAWLTIRLYSEARAGDTASSLSIAGLSTEILAALCGHDEVRLGHPPAWLARTHELLNDRFSDELAHDEIAAAAGVHPVHLASVFRRHYGCTIGEYIRRMRLEHACRRLTHPGEPLADIALTAGFFDQSHFTRTFKRYTGATPRQYRQQLGHH